MAQKRIKRVQPNTKTIPATLATTLLTDKVRLLYDDGSQGELDMTKCRTCFTQFDTLVGLTRKQAKMKLGIKS